MPQLHPACGTRWSPVSVEDHEPAFLKSLGVQRAVTVGVHTTRRRVTEVNGNAASGKSWARRGLADRQRWRATVHRAISVDGDGGCLPRWVCGRRRVRRGHTPGSASTAHPEPCVGYVVDTLTRTPDTCR